jgi:hypothetical protein
VALFRSFKTKGGKAAKQSFDFDKSPFSTATKIARKIFTLASIHLGLSSKDLWKNISDDFTASFFLKDFLKERIIEKGKNLCESLLFI